VRARLFVMMLACAICIAAELPDIRARRADLTTPPMTEGAPAPGRRVRQVTAGYEGKAVYHALYLPRDWKPGRRYPVLVEYAGNGGYRNRFGDVSTGRVEGSNLGYGISGGKGFIWVSMPFVNSHTWQNQTTWWGEVDATVDYAKRTVREVIERWGGDRSAVILTGFSRGAIACNYIGLHDDEIAAIWLAFIPYSHYDGVRAWRYPGSDRTSALTRLRRLNGRASFIIHEESVEETRAYVESTGVRAPFTFLTLPYRNHNDGWVLRNIPERRVLRKWLKRVLRTRRKTDFSIP